MTTSPTNMTLRRITAQTKEASQAKAMSPSKAMRLSLSRAADRLFDLALGVVSIDQDAPGLPKLLERLGDDRLLVLLDGPDRRRGVMALDAQVLAGLIESQTVGTVIHGPARARRATPTDAALIAPLFDGFLESFAACLAGEDDADWAQGFQTGDRAENRQLLGLALDAHSFHAFTLSIDLANGAKQGEIILAFPEIDAAQDSRAPAGAGGQPGAEMGPVIMAVPAEIRAVLCALRMPFDALRKLEVGDRLTLPHGALAALRLEAGGTVIGEGMKLGRADGMRAVRLRPNGTAAEPPSDLAGEAAPTLAPPPAPELAAAAAAPAPIPQPSEDAPAFDDLPDLGDLGDLPEMSDLGDMSALPDLSVGDDPDDLPALPPLSLAGLDDTG